MVNFGKKILAATQQSPWAPHFLDYDRLKQIVEQEEQGDGDGGTPGALEAGCDVSVAPSVTSDATLPVPDCSNLFLHALHAETEKIVLFFLAEQGKIAEELASCRQELSHLCYPLTSGEHMTALATPATLDTESDRNSEAKASALEQRYDELGLRLLRLIHFVDVNVTGIRKILKKHDKVLRSSPLSSAFLASAAVQGTPRPGRRWQLRRQAANYGNQLVKPLLQDDALGALVVSLETGIQDVRNWRYQRHQGDHLLQDASETLPRPPPISAAPGHSRRRTAPNYQTLLGYDRWSPPGMVPGSVQSQYRKRAAPRAQSVTLSAGEIQLHHHTDHLLMQIHAARRRLQQTNDFVHMLAAPMMMESRSSSSLEDVASMTSKEPTEEGEEEAEEESFQAFSNFLNLMSTFLYMTNYYIVAPTSASYAEKLGGTAAMAGIVIGLTPIAALVSTVLYSWWTSHSYKAALIFASSCSVIGNLFYAAGLPSKSLTVVMIGRLLNGFGSARSINRRYIVDTFPRAERTAASAAFVTAGALGMAAGPAIASALHLWTAQHDELHRSSLFWQAENAPGWFMFVVWSVYLICLIFFFVDPSWKRTDAAGQKAASAASLEMIEGEKRPLLPSGGQTGDAHLVTPSSSLSAFEKPIWRNPPVVITFWIYFVLKLVLEAVLSSESVVTKLYFGWDSSAMGIYLAALGLLMLPANLAISWLARSYDDRELIMGMQALMVLGCIVILQYSSNYTLAQYVVGSVVLFISTNALEGPNMSLLSKTIPSSWSKGIFNVGLLSTEAGTLGRAVGDVLLTAFGSGGLEHLVNKTFGSFAALSFGTLLLSLRFYDYMDPAERDD